MRAPDLDAHFPADQLVECFEQTLSGLGIDLRSQRGVVLDLEPRPSKTPRAFCAPARVPDEVYLVLSPIGGHDDFAILFHEGGHTEHYASVQPGLPFEYRMLGDNAITESFAFLLERLVENPVWLEERLGITNADAIAAHGRATRALYLRRYCAKFTYELELHDAAAGAATARRPLRRATERRDRDRLVRRELPRRRRSRLLFVVLPAGLGARNAPAPPSRRSLRSALVRRCQRRARCCGRSGRRVSA